MSEKEKQLVNNLMDIVDKLPEAQQHRLLGVAEGMSMVSADKEVVTHAETKNHAEGHQGHGL